MGYSISWVATKGVTEDQILRKLGLSRTGQFGEYARHNISGATLPSGWFLLVARGCDHPILQPEVLADLAQNGCRVVASSIEEHVMHCSVEEWQNGIRVWRVEHNAQNGMLHLKAEGVLPEGYQEVKITYMAHQNAEGGEKADIDYYFEIPLQTAKNIAGFKHDEQMTGSEPVRFEAMTGRWITDAGRTASKVESTRPWWRLWR